MKYSCIRYVISPSEGINDNVWTDPRTGEIISANIYICHNLPMQIQRDRLLQTAAYDKSARTLTLNEEDFGKAFVSMLMRNIGHCLGLTDNLAGSAAYSTDSLRSAGFTKEKGLSSSVMDDLTFNYLLSADHYKKGTHGVRSRSENMIIGLYDGYTDLFLMLILLKKNLLC